MTKCETCGQEIKVEKTIQKIPAKTLIWGKTSEYELSWNEANEWCKEQGGRMPTLIELLQAYESRINGFQSSSYWSATEDGAPGAWSVNMSTGYTNGSNKNSNYYVRCVVG